MSMATRIRTLPARPGTAQARNAIVQALCAIRRYREINDQVLPALCRKLGAGSAVLLSYRMHGGRLVAHRHGLAYGAPGDAIRDYAQRFAALDPVTTAAESVHRSGAAPLAYLLHLAELVSPRALRRSEYYNDFLVPNRAGHCLGLMMPVRGLSEQLYCIGLHRDLGESPFRERQIRVLRALAPAIHATLQGQVLSSLVECLATSVTLPAAHRRSTLILDRELQLLDCDSSAHDCGVLAADGALQPALQQQLASGSWDEQHLPRLFLHPGATGPLEICAHRQRLRNGEIRIVVQAVAPAAARADTADRRFNLPLGARQAQVVNLLRSGHSSKRIAELMGISARTVENHLRVIYRRFGVHSRGQLLAQLDPHAPRRLL